MTPVARRLCEGCDLPLPADAHPNRRYHDAECARLARQRAGDALGRQATLLFPGPRAGGNARSGLQVSYRRAVDVAVDALGSYVMAAGSSRAEARDEIAEALAAALPERQRAQLEARANQTQEVT